MVVFTCNHCGQSVRKNQVDKHYQFQCRNSKSLSCMDCGKDFYNEDFKKHTKCISENEKYGGKDYVPTVNKGEVKQEQWIEQIKNAIATSNMSPQLSNLMEQLMEFNNIPRKKIKFENFIRNSVRVKNPKLIGEAWEIFSKAQNPKENNQKEEKSEKRKLEESSDDGNAKKKQKKEVENDVGNAKKKQKKEAENDVGNAKKKQKKEAENDVGNAKKKQKKEVKNDESVLQNGSENSGDETLDETMTNGSGTKKKFKWKRIIVQVLRQASDHELSVKKLRKKVLAEYMACAESGKPLSENELYAKFEKKISKNPKFKVFKDRVKLKE